MNGSAPNVGRSLIAAILLASTLTLGCGKESPERIVGKWEGKIEVKEAAVQQELNRVANDPALMAVVKKQIDEMRSMVMTVEFQPSGTMSMTADIPAQDGTKTLSTSGRWEVTSTDGDTLVIKSIESQGTEEELRMCFEGNDEFTMHKAMGVLRFHRLR